MTATASKSAKAGGAEQTGTARWANPGANGERLGIEDFPTFLISRMESLARAKLTRSYLDGAGISMPEWRVLTILTRFSPTTYPALVQRSTMDKGQISLTLRTLVARGWITWGEAAANTGDLKMRRGSRIVAITSKGRAAIRKVMPDARRAQMRLLSLMPREDRVVLHAMLCKTLAALEQIDVRDVA